jgi:hypothetical protein
MVDAQPDKIYRHECGEREDRDGRGRRCRNETPAANEHRVCAKSSPAPTNIKSPT